MSKEELEKHIKQNLIKKDKETIIDLCLQMKFERDIVDEQLAELKAEYERCQQMLVNQKGQIITLQQQLKEAETHVESLELQLREQYQLVDEKDEQLDFLATEKIVIEAIRSVLSKDMNYFCGIDGICDYYFHCSELLSKFYAGNFNVDNSKEIIQYEISNNFKGLPLEYYGWAIKDVENAINKYLKAELEGKR